ncbi:MAG: DUF1080 domain-containing protein [Kiritimatiellia bacterium]|nr:DUF1080 domain-containing protein [Kiritimatiellia bacterium]MDP6847810.1 DUF1080 domain-containing protein [Kiritimatiellia bacterium]
MNIRLACVLMLTAMCVSLVSSADNEWQVLFDGKTLEGWQLTNGQPVSKGWVVEEGCIHRASGGGNIVSVGEYKDFELELEWKISEGGNSGIKYRFTKGLGPEYQVLDDEKHVNGKNPLTSAAAMYAMFKCNDQKTLMPVGEFNQARIVAKGTRLEHWLNGKLVLETDTSSDDWAKAKAKSKFKGKQGYGEGPGRIFLQDHGNKVWYRNIRIRKISQESK